MTDDADRLADEIRALRIADERSRLANVQMMLLLMKVCFAIGEVMEYVETDRSDVEARLASFSNISNSLREVLDETLGAAKTLLDQKRT